MVQAQQAATLMRELLPIAGQGGRLDVTEVTQQ
jgi:hypothetical protein